MPAALAAVVCGLFNLQRLVCGCGGFAVGAFVAVVAVASVAVAWLLCLPWVIVGASGAVVVVVVVDAVGVGGAVGGMCDICGGGSGAGEGGCAGKGHAIDCSGVGCPVGPKEQRARMLQRQ